MVLAARNNATLLEAPHAPSTSYLDGNQFAAQENFARHGEGARPELVGNAHAREEAELVALGDVGRDRIANWHGLHDRERLQRGSEPLAELQLPTHHGVGAAIAAKAV